MNKVLIGFMSLLFLGLAGNSTGGTTDTKMISEIISGKSFRHSVKNGSTRTNTFDKDCKTVTNYKDGVKTGTYPVTCGETAVFKPKAGKTVTFSSGWAGLTKEVDLGFKTKSFSPKEVPNPK